MGEWSRSVVPPAVIASSSTFLTAPTNCLHWARVTEDAALRGRTDAEICRYGLTTAQKSGCGEFRRPCPKMFLKKWEPLRLKRPLA